MIVCVCSREKVIGNGISDEKRKGDDVKIEVFERVCSGKRKRRCWRAAESI